MVLCGSCMYWFSVSNDMKKKYNGKRRFSTYLLENLLTLTIKELKTSVEQGTMVTTMILNKH